MCPVFLPDWIFEASGTPEVPDTPKLLGTRKHDRFHKQGCPRVRNKSGRGEHKNIERKKTKEMKNENKKERSKKQDQ